MKQSDIITLAHIYAMAAMNGNDRWDTVYGRMTENGITCPPADQTDAMEDAITDAAHDLYPEMIP